MCVCAHQRNILPPAPCTLRLHSYWYLFTGGTEDGFPSLKAPRCAPCHGVDPTLARMPRGWNTTGLTAYSANKTQYPFNVG